MVFEFINKEEFEKCIFEVVKELGETNICNIINFYIKDNDKKKLKKIYGDKKIGNIIFDYIEKSGKYEITDKSAKDKNVWKIKITEEQHNNIGQLEQNEGIDQKDETKPLLELGNKFDSLGTDFVTEETIDKQTGENPFELPDDDLPDVSKKPKVNKSLKGQINDSMVQVNEFFCICKYPVTQVIYNKIMGVNPSEFKDNPDGEEKQDERPVEMVSYLDAIKFCDKLSELCGYEQCYKTGNCNSEANGFRLPTENEWIFVANGGAVISKEKYSGTSNPLAVWCDISSNLKTHQVGLSASISINGEEVYDMSGNIWEMCEPGVNSNKVPCLGGSFKDSKNKLELGKDTNREEIAKEYKNCAIGFRLCVNSLKK